MEKSRKPKIRFKGYNDDWEQRELGDCSEIFLGLTYTPKYVDEGKIFISSKDIAKDYLDLSEPKYISEEEFNRSSENAKPKKGDILFTRVGSNLGHPVIIETKEKLCIFVSLGYLRPLNFVHNYYMKYWMCSPDFKTQIFQKTGGGAKVNVNTGWLRKFSFQFSKNIEEQIQIGVFFKNIDNLITLHQRKLEKLMNVKKSMLEKMFPKQGSVVPEIRFCGFTDAWEQRELGNIGQTYTGLSGKTKDDFGHGHAQFVTYMNVFSNPISNPKMNEPIEVDSKQNEVEVGDVFFTTSSETPKEVGMTSVLIEKQGKMYLNSFCFGYRLYEKYDSYYLAYMLRSNSFREKIIMLAQGISRYNISKNKVMEIDVFIPSYKEQMEIGKYFRDFDTLITLHQRKLEKLKNIKKSMLEKMFI